MGRNVLETVLGMGVIVIAIGFLVFGVRYVDTDATKDTYTAYAYFNNVGGLKAGADIRISGVLVGRVEHVRINMDEFKAEVKMQVSKSIVLPMDTLVSVADSSLLGGKYITFTMGTSAKLVQNGGRLNNVADVVSLEQMLGKLIFLGTQ